MTKTLFKNSVRATLFLEGHSAEILVNFIGHFTRIKDFDLLD
jgi:hypothetical protein